MNYGKKYLIIWSFLFFIVPLTAFWSGIFLASHKEPPTLNSKDKKNIIEVFRSAITKKHYNLKKLPNIKTNLPLFVTFLNKGKIIASCKSDKPSLKQQILQCKQVISGKNYPINTRIRVDLAYSKVTLPNIPFLKSLFLLPGIEGFAGTNEKGVTEYILPLEMYINNALAGSHPLKFIPQLQIGVNFEKLINLLRNKLKAEPIKFFRVAFISLVDDPRGSYFDVLRENIDKKPKLTSKTVYEAAIRGGMYMVRTLIKDKTKLIRCSNCKKGFFRTDKGQFIYNYHLISDKTDFQSKYVYNLPRHAGTTYAIANLYKITKLPVFKETAQIAIEYLNKMASGQCKGIGFRCVSNKRMADLGSSALALVALAEYRFATKDTKFDAFIKDLAEFLLFMQRKDGSFNHIYDVKTQKPDSKPILLYYSGEAALALAKTYKIFKKKKYALAVEKALDWLTTEQVKQLPFKFAFGEEHWTCQAANEIKSFVKKRRYLDFCVNFAKYIKRHQYHYGETNFDDFVGGYGVSPFIPVHINGAGSRTESNVSTFELAQSFGDNTSELNSQIKLALVQILRHQRTRTNCWLCENSDFANGSIANTPIDLTVRIDTVQHTTTALIRAWQTLFHKK